MKIKAVLFDMDGTLVNSMDDLASATNYAMGQFGFPEKPAEEYKKYAGNGVYVMIKRALQPASVSDVMLKKIRDIFFDYYKDHCTVHTVAYNGINELVDTLKKKNIKVGCITNKVEPIANDIINHFFGGMDIVYGQTDGIPTKPDPTLTVKALNKLHILPSECLFAGDSGVDMQTANNSGAIAVGVLWGFRTKEELTACGAKHIVKTPKEILELLKKDE